MLVQRWMSKEVITVDAEDSMNAAIKLMKKHDISRLPVLKNGKLVGIVTDGDIKRASASDATSLEIHELLYLLSQIRINEIMTRNPITVPPDYTVEEVAQILRENKISGVPVVDKNGVLVGIITKNDLFEVMISMTGVAKRGIHFAFRLVDRPGSIKEVADVIREYGGRMVSILSTHDRAPEGYRNVYIRAYYIDRKDVPELLEKLKKKAIIRYVVDHRENTRQIFQD